MCNIVLNTHPIMAPRLGRKIEEFRKINKKLALTNLKLDIRKGNAITGLFKYSGRVGLA